MSPETLAVYLQSIERTLPWWVLLPGACVGAKARVEGSIVGGGARVGARARIRGLSVIGFGDVVEPGVVLDGYRSPEPGTRVASTPAESRR